MSSGGQELKIIEQMVRGLCYYEIEDSEKAYACLKVLDGEWWRGSLQAEERALIARGVATYGDVLCETGRQADAEQTYRSFLESNLTTVDRAVTGMVYRSLAALYANMQRWSEALDLYEKAGELLERWFDSGSVIEGTIRCQMALGKSDAAKSTLTSALLSQPTLEVRVPLYLVGAELAKMSNNRDEALSYLWEIKELVEHYPWRVEEDVLDSASLIAWNYKEVDLAYSIARHVEVLDNYECPAVSVFIMSLYAKNSFSDCIRVCDRVIRTPSAMGSVLDTAIKLKMYSQARVDDSCILDGINLGDVRRLAKVDGDIRAFLKEHDVNIDLNGSDESTH
ncbi:MAG: tetratricopeptide repeat protein [Nitrososphaera sp.]